MIKREKYLDMLKSFKDKDLIKIVTGIRRCGKSTLFTLYIDYLKSIGVNDEQIIHINLEDPEYAYLDDYEKLYSFVKGKCNEKVKNYVFLDETQNINMFEKALDGLFLKKYIDLYVTGSNAYLLSSEYATVLSGRYVEIKMYPLSFEEYVSATDIKDNEKNYNNYITKGSFPYTLFLDKPKDIEMYLKSIYDSIILKDIITRKQIPDQLMLQSVINFLFSNIGSMTSTTNITNTLVANGRKISIHTVESYISSLTDAFLFHKVGRYDIKGKEYLKTLDKYYVADLGLRYFLLGKKQGDLGHILENFVYLELVKLGYEVSVGKVGDREVDFVATNSDGIKYFQISLTVREKSTYEREIRPLFDIKDHYPKYLITLDNDPKSFDEGIIIQNVFEWINSEK